MQANAMALRFSVGLVRASLHAAVVLSLELLDSPQ